MTPLAIVTAVPLLAWIGLLLCRGGFWRMRERFDSSPPAPLRRPPAVVAVIPARNEADVIGRAIRSVAGQDYPGRLHIVLVDDQSDDGTAAVARTAVPDTGALTIVRSEARPADWAPKVWAMAQGYRRVAAIAPDARYVWLTDADIEHADDTLTRLVGKAEAGSLDQVSLMVELEIAGAWERLLIPAFVLFFQKLYPFAWANDPARRTAAAAGGCILASRAALDQAGAFESIRGALIDDCDLARVLKRVARTRGRGTWLGLTTDSRSIRAYGGLRGVWRMVARSAFTQLDYSWLKVVGTLLGMLLLYALPPIALCAWPLHGDGVTTALGALGWLLMAGSMLPILRYYRQPRLLSLALPLAGVLYAGMTLSSALSWAQGHGSRWKGRALGTPEKRDAGDGCLPGSPE